MRKSSTTKDTLQLRSAQAPVHEPCGTGASWLRAIKFKSRTISVRSLRRPIFFCLLLDWLPKFVFFPSHFRPWSHVGDSALVTCDHNFRSLKDHRAIFGTRSAYPARP